MERVLVRTTCIIRHAKHRVALCQTEPYGSRDPYFESWIDPPDNDGHWSPSTISGQAACGLRVPRYDGDSRVVPGVSRVECSSWQALVFLSGRPTPYVSDLRLVVTYRGHCSLIDPSTCFATQPVILPMLSRRLSGHSCHWHWRAQIAA